MCKGHCKHHNNHWGVFLGLGGICHSVADDVLKLEFHKQTDFFTQSLEGAFMC